MKTVAVTKKQLHGVLDCGRLEGTYESYLADTELEAEGTMAMVDEATFTALKECDLKPIIADSHMSENHPGGDDLVDVADQVLAAIKGGYAIATWYGPNTEALVVSYRPDEATIVEGEQA